jgi:hypothetical protein
MPECTDCSRSYKNEDSLRVHRNKYHGGRKSISNISRYEPYPTNKYKCEQCSKVFPTLASLYTHKQRHHPVITIVNHGHHGAESTSNASDQESWNDVPKSLPIHPKANPKATAKRILDDDSAPTPKKVKRQLSDADSSSTGSTPQFSDSDESLENTSTDYNIPKQKRTDFAK